MQYIIPLLAAVVIAFLQLASSNGTSKTAGNQAAVSTAIGDAEGLAKSIQSDYGAEGAFTTLTNAVALNDGDVPTDMNVSGTIINHFGGTVNVNPDAGNPAEFDEVWSMVPQSACAHFAAGVSSAVSASINGGDALTQPIDPGVAGSSCQAGSNTVTLVFNSQE